ncbi:MAG: family 10 glycosylhydrolase [Gemmatimonadota bacterium]|nr:family 10 glycosylhydrolase [Gemmatimonadota bacterium]
MKKYALSLLFTLIVIALQAGFPGENAAAAENPAEKYVAEARGTWIGMRKDGANWDSTMAALANAGFNMVFPCMCSGGAAIYPSEFLPMVSGRDELDLCIQAAHKYGIEVHVWRINWYMSQCPDSFAVEMEKAGRIQYSWDGKRNPEVMRERGYKQNRDWLCPSQPENRKLEFDSMLELVKKYDVDGVHFDYMRFSNDQLCYCDKCRENFEKETGIETVWPEDVWKEGKYREVYLDWRRSLIHSSAREIARAVHMLDPYVCVSLAARTSVKWAYESDAQEWWAWIREGILDFVCPMNYTTNPEKFVTVMKSHLPLTRGAVPYYSGIGLYQMKEYTPFKKNVELGRELGQDGFVTFELRTLLPELEESGSDLTSRPALLPHRAPETRFILKSSGRESEEGFFIYSQGDSVKFELSVMMTGKLKEGINRIQGDVALQRMNGETVSEIRSLDLERSARKNMAIKCSQPGRYRLALSGTMTLGTGKKKLFITKSFPFEVAAQ